MSSRFELEQKILGTWNITEELKVINRGVLDHGWSSDQISNALIGLAEIYDIKFQETFAEFENVLREMRK
jgi:uncharacterized protein YfkK (UPF0435 family)